MRELEWYVLGDGDHAEVIVDVTEVAETSKVTEQLATEWTWDSFQVQFLPGEDGEGPTEWMTLIGARRRITEAAA